jgi:hypothetical protein
MNFANVKAITIPEGNVKQITDGNGVVIWKKDIPQLKITSITNPSVGTSSITGDRTATLSRSSNNNAGPFNVNFQNYDVSKGAGIKVSITAQFGYCYFSAGSNMSSVLVGVTSAHVTMVVGQTKYQGETKSGNITIYPTRSAGSFIITISNGANSYGNTNVNVSLTIDAL